TPDRIGSQCVPLTAGPEAPSQARRAASTYLRRTCPSLDPPDRCDDVLLIVSELVTNAVRYTPPDRALSL
ncbi:ATP-binding protein, partial [Streptomyces sp. SID7803]|nr:ATP-binding protein [Streptomyces sp. SID7803]